MRTHLRVETIAASSCVILRPGDTVGANDSFLIKTRSGSGHFSLSTILIAYVGRKIITPTFWDTKKKKDSEEKVK